MTEPELSDFLWAVDQVSANHAMHQATAHGIGSELVTVVGSDYALPPLMPWTRRTGAHGPEDGEESPPSPPPRLIIGDYDLVATESRDSTPSGTPAHQTDVSAENRQEPALPPIEALAHGTQGESDTPDTVRALALRAARYEPQPRRPFTFVHRDRTGAEVWNGTISRVRFATPTRSPLAVFTSMGRKLVDTLRHSPSVPGVVCENLGVADGYRSVMVNVCDAIDGEGAGEAALELRASKPISSARKTWKRRATQRKLAQWRKRFEDQEIPEPLVNPATENPYSDCLGQWTTEREIGVVADIVTTIGTLLPFNSKFIVEGRRRLRDFYKSHKFWGNNAVPEDVMAKLICRGVQFLRPVWLEFMAEQQDLLNHADVFEWTETWKEVMRGEIVLKGWFSAWWSGEVSLWGVVRARKTGRVAIE